LLVMSGNSNANSGQNVNKNAEGLNPNSNNPSLSKNGMAKTVPLAQIPRNNSLQQMFMHVPNTPPIAYGALSGSPMKNMGGSGVSHSVTNLVATGSAGGSVNVVSGQSHSAMNLVATSSTGGLPMAGANSSTITHVNPNAHLAAVMSAPSSAPSASASLLPPFPPTHSHHHYHPHRHASANAEFLY